MNIISQVMLALAIKHFLADYVFNSIPSNKHIYGSSGSIRHLSIHMFWCFIVLIWILPLDYVIMATAFDGFIHYHEDYIKSKFIYKHKELSIHSKRIVTGFDQLVHILTYILIAWAVT